MLEHLDDLASDFSAIHGVRDIAELDGPVFFRLAFRIASYQGVMRDTVMAEQAVEQQAQVSADGGARQMTGGTRAELQSDPMFAQIFSFSQAASG